MYPTLTKRQKEILDYIKVYTELNGYAPSLVDIKNHFQLSAISTVHEHIQNLKEKGYIHKEMNQARSLRPIDPNSLSSEFSEIVILGKIKDDNTIEHAKSPNNLFLHKDMLQVRGKLFALIVTTDKLKPSGFNRDDLLIFVETNEPKEGDIIVCEIDKVNLLRKFSISKSRYVLEELENNLESKTYNQTAVKLVGSLVKLIRDF